MTKLGIEESIYELIFQEITNHLLHSTVPAFWDKFQGAIDGESTFRSFCITVSELHVVYKRLQTILDKAQLLKSNHTNFLNKENLENPFNRFDFILKSALLSQLPFNFSDYVHAFYEFSFRIFSGRHLDGDSEAALRIEDIVCNVCGNETTECQCQEYIAMFHDVNKKLLEMSILDRLCGVTITDLVEQQNENSVKEICQGVLRSSNIKTLENWLENIVLNWLKNVYHYELETDRMKALFENFRTRLTYFMYETYATVIIDQFFDIIIGRL